MKLKVTKSDDRDAMIVILARNGYTVRQVREKQSGDKTYTNFVEVVDHAE